MQEGREQTGDGKEEAGARPLRIFLSYSRKDKDFIVHLANALTARGYIADFDQTLITQTPAIQALPRPTTGGCACRT